MQRLEFVKAHTEAEERGESMDALRIVAGWRIRFHELDTAVPR